MNGTYGTYDIDTERNHLVKEATALVLEVDAGTNTTADPELVALARRLVKANASIGPLVADGVMAWSRSRSQGASLEEQENAARPFTDAMSDVQAEMDRIIRDLGRLAAVA